jgi:hypothetical protein
MAQGVGAELKPQYSKKKDAPYTCSLLLGIHCHLPSRKPTSSLVSCGPGNDPNVLHGSLAMLQKHALLNFLGSPRISSVVYSELLEKLSSTSQDPQTTVSSDQSCLSCSSYIHTAFIILSTAFILSGLYKALHFPANFNSPD